MHPINSCAFIRDFSVTFGVYTNDITFDKLFGMRGFTTIFGDYNNIASAFVGGPSSTHLAKPKQLASFNTSEGLRRHLRRLHQHRLCQTPFQEGLHKHL
jgi:hypothetical protein